MKRKQLFLSAALLGAAIIGVSSILWWRSRDRVRTLTLATGSASGEYYAFGKALAEIVSRYHPQLQIVARATAGSQENQQLLSQGRVDLALIQSDTLATTPSQLAAFLFPEPVHVLARTDAGIDRIADLRGKRVALPPVGSGTYALFGPISQHYGLQTKDFAALTPLPVAKARAALQAGEVDALFLTMGLGNPSMRALLQDDSLRLVPIEQGAALGIFQPAFETSRIPQGTYGGSPPIPPEDLSTITVRALLLAHRDLKPEVVQAIVQTIFEARSELIALHPLTGSIPTPDNLPINPGVALHPGAKAYYNPDRPSFLLKYAELLGFLLSAGVLAVSGIWQFRAWLDARQKNRADRYNREILELLGALNAIEDAESLRGARHELFEIFAQVVIDLDEDRISPESFQSFTFTWEVADRALRHREALMSRSLRPKPSNR